MKPWILLTLLAMLITPLRLAAFEHGRPDGRTVDAREAGNPAGDVISHEMRVRLGLPIRVPLRPEIREQIHRARHDRRHADRYPSYAPTIATTTVINEIRPVVVVSPPAETESPAPVKREWVPPPQRNRYPARVLGLRHQTDLDGRSLALHAGFIEENLGAPHPGPGCHPGRLLENCRVTGRPSFAGSHRVAPSATVKTHLKAPARQAFNDA